MSLVTQKFQEGGETPEVRLYKRGNDQVNLDDFVRQAEAGFNNWLNNVDIKDKHKKEVRDAYQDLITRINDDPESFTARLGGGFTNTAGITNASKGFDAYGVAAGYLGNTLRSMSVYTKPEVKSDKKKYGRNSGLITSTMQEQIWGNSPDSFIKLDDDSFDEATGKRALTHRTAQTITGLQTLKGSLKDYYDFDSDEDYNHAIARIDSAIASLQNGNPNDDWFTLSQLGMTNLDRFFSTGADKRTTPYTPEEQQLMGQQGQVRDFEDWMSSNRPFYIGQLDRISIGEQDGNASYSEVNALVNRLDSLGNEALKNWIFDYIENPTYDMTHHPTMLQIFGGAVRYGAYTPSQIMRGVLARAIENGLGKKASDTLYYFPDTLEQHSDGSSTVYAYNLETQSLDQMDTQDIAAYQQQYFNEYRAARPQSSYAGNSQYSSRYPQMYASHKKGGILKAGDGTELMYGKTVNSGNWTGIGHTDGYNWYTNGFSNWVDDLLADASKAQTPEEKQAFADLVNLTQHNHSPLATRWSGTGAYKGTDNDVANYQQGINDNFGYVNTKGIKAIRAGNFYADPEKPYGIDSEAEGWKPDNHFSAQTDDRRVLGRRITAEDGTIMDDYTPEQLADIQQRFKDAGYDMYWDDSDNYYKLKLLSSNPDVPEEGQADVVAAGVEPGTEAGAPAEGAPGDTSAGTDGKTGGGDDKKYKLEEILANLKELSVKNNLAKTGFWGELGADLLGAGRLAGSIWTNNRIAKTVRESLRPRLHNTYELYSPVTGAFSEMQLRNRQGADTLSQSYRPFTSDASLAAARMLEGQRSANDLQYQGFIADDNEIRRTQAEALKRQEDNVARRSALANENRDAILANNQAVAQLEASRVKQNWNSIDNYLQGVEGRMRQRMTEDRDRRNNFALQTGQSEADTWRETQIAALRDRYRKWANGDTSKTFSDWVTLNQDSYTTAMKRINAVTAAMKYRNYADVYGLKYNWPTMTVNGSDVPLDFDITTLPWQKHGGPLKPTASYLIDKIIRQNNK